MIDFLYGLDYDNHYFDTKGPPSVNGNNKSAPSLLIYKFRDKTKLFEPADTNQPARHNSDSLLINVKAYVIVDKYNV
jgi:hypothetical protein